MLGDERAYPGQFGQYTNLGFTKREVIGIQMAQGILQGLYSFQGNIGSLTEIQIARAAWKMADSLVKKS